MSDTYTQGYSNFVGVDLSSDPRAVARNRLAYAENMWRDYESEQGEAIETFPGFRRLVRGLGTVHGIFSFRGRDGGEYLVVHAGTRLYSFRDEYIAAMSDVALNEEAALRGVSLRDSDSHGFIFNNKLYILDGENFVVVESVTDKDGAVSVTAGELDAYVPTTYLNGEPYEQRNMLTDEAYEIFTEEVYEDKNRNSFGYFEYEIDSIRSVRVFGFKRLFRSPYITLVDYSAYKGIRPNEMIFEPNAFSDTEVREICIMVERSVVFDFNCFSNCPNLERVKILFNQYNDELAHFKLDIAYNAFEGCPKLEKIEVFNKNYSQEESDSYHTGLNPADWAINNYSGKPISITKVATDEELFSHKSPTEYGKRVAVAELARFVSYVVNMATDSMVRFGYSLKKETVNNETIEAVEYIYMSRADLEYTDADDDSEEPVKYMGKSKARLTLDPLHFSTIENVKNYRDGNPDYRGTGVEAINHCTKSAVFDGRIFLTGNPELPNTVFYSHRNLTGANDPTYFGAYNYFNDGDGNTPNVDLLSTPSMLMVLKNSTVQDGSVYYHTGAFNDDEKSYGLVPRIYPSTSGAAGLGCAGKLVPGTVACNFLDDAVFLSVRGLEAVGKQTVNLERTIAHRSGNVDRLLVTEDLSGASIAEWKGYLVICCRGNFYLADSRVINQHSDGSYQYEWYFLKGLGCYDAYTGGYRYLRDWYAIDDSGNTLDDCTVIINGTQRRIGDVFLTLDEDFRGDSTQITVWSAQRPDGSQFYFYADGDKALEAIDEERTGVGAFNPIHKIVTVGDRLYLATEGGDVCVVNTDKRGVPDYDGQIFESNRIASRWYSFGGLRYPSVAVTRLDDCSKPMLAKGTVYGTAVARFKMMPGSRATVRVSTNGRDFKTVGEAYAERYDAGSLDFSNFSFGENEDAVLTLRELTRNWVDKQYSFTSDGFCEPFGLYEISYLYVTKGRIRRPFATVERK